MIYIKVFLLLIAIYFIITFKMHKINIFYNRNNSIRFIIQVLILSNFVKICIFKKQKTLFLCFYLKIFIDCQRISLKNL